LPAVVSKLLDQNVIAGRMRRSGGGRKRVEKKISDIVVLIEFLLEYDTAGDPIKGLKWPRRTTEKIAMTLEDFGVTVSPNTVARLLHKGYSLRVNHKSFPPISVPTAMSSFSGSPNCAIGFSGPVCPSSAWIPKSANWSATSTITAHVGICLRVW
jgi:hypothetical protein